MKRSALVFVIALCVSVTAAASSQTGKIKRLYVRASDGLTYFTMDSATPSDKPSCATHSYWMIKDENSEVGKKQYAMLLAAHAAGRKILIYGSDKCTRWRDGEDVDSVVLLENE